MHELGIATEIIEAARAARDDSGDPNARIIAIGLRIGALAGVDAESLRFCFEALAGDSEFAGTVLQIEATPGAELDFKYLEVEQDDGTDHGRAESTE